HREHNTYTHNDIKVEIDAQNRVIISAIASELRFVALRWNGCWPRGARFMGDTFERSYGDLRWRSLETENIMSWYFLMHTDTYNEGYGVKVRPDALCFWVPDNDGLTLWLDVRNGGTGVVLSGRTIMAAEMVCASAADTNACLFHKRFCGMMCASPLLAEKPVYGGNNWCYAYGDSSAEQILKDASIIREASEGLENKPYMVIDDGWQELSRSAYAHAEGRPYDRGNILFPDMPGLAAEMKSMGVKPGLWMRPLKTAEKYISKSLLLEGRPFTMDASLPEVMELVSDDISRLVKWGYELIKYDYVVKDVLGELFITPSVLRSKGWHFANRGVTSAEILKNLSRVIHEAAGNATLIGCNVAGHLAAGHIHLHRSGDDTSGRSYTRSIKMGINTLAFRAAQNKVFFATDADCVCITDKIPWEQNRQVLELYSMSGTPLFVSVQPEALNDEIRYSLKTAFVHASKQTQQLEPVDWLDTALPEEYLIDGKKYSYKWTGQTGNDWIFMT
ncbi:MAG: alpha-galactosidase, partial [Clostridiales bacterium]|nr:alpha-galactosidase [Clostridiales bacterium]